MMPAEGATRDEAVDKREAMGSRSRPPRSWRAVENARRRGLGFLFLACHPARATRGEGHQPEFRWL